MERMQKARESLEQIKSDLTRVSEIRNNKDFLVAASMIGEALQHFDHAVMFVENAIASDKESGKAIKKQIHLELELREEDLFRRLKEIKDVDSKET
jgi:hypothetical protein